MNKAHVLRLLVQRLEADILVAEEAVQVARDTATHKDCLGSSKYETMGTEASYLAKGQGERLCELQRALAHFKQVKVQAHPSVALACLLTLEAEDGTQKHFWLDADAGGLQVNSQGETITIITAQAPLGRALLGHVVGDSIEIKMAGKAKYYTLINLL